MSEKIVVFNQEIEELIKYNLCELKNFLASSSPTYKTEFELVAKKISLYSSRINQLVKINESDNPVLIGFPTL